MRLLRALAHFAALLGIAAWALALGRLLRDPSLAGAAAVAALTVLLALALHHLYRRGGLANPQAGLTPNVEGQTPSRVVEGSGAGAPLFDHGEPERG